MTVNRTLRHLTACLLMLALCASGAMGAVVKGFVLDRSGNPIPGADLDFIDVVTGNKRLFFNDNTGLLGEYSVSTKDSVYHISYEPPDSSHFLGAWMYNVDLTPYGPFEVVPLPDVILNPGWKISGVVTDPFGAPVGDADIDVDSIGGGRVFTPNDNTKLFTGAYWIVVPPLPDQYRIRFDSPPGSRLRGLQLDTVLVSGDTTIDVQLSTGVLLDGFITDNTGAGIFDVDIDLRDAATGAKIFVSNNSTDTAGYYNVAVPTGFFQLRVSPPQGSRLTGVRVDSFLINGDVTFDTTLSEGVLVTCIARDSLTNQPVPGADLDFKQVSTGTKIFTPYDKTGPDGTTTVAVAADRYNIQLDPPPGTIYSQLILPDVDIGQDTTIEFRLKEVPRINLSGTVADTGGAGLAGAKIDLRIPLTGIKISLSNNRTDINGAFSIRVPIGTFNLFVTPPPSTNYVGRRIEDITFVTDTTIDTIALRTGLYCTAIITDELDTSPIADVDLGFFSESTSLEIFTPGDNTDTTGAVQVVVPVDVYTLLLTPSDGSPYLPRTVTGLNLSSDTTLSFSLVSKLAQRPEAGFVLRQSYPNPFNVGTVIDYVILEEREVSLKVYNVLGQLVKNLAHDYPTASAGLHSVLWDGTNNNGQSVASGVYFYRLTTDKGSDTRRTLLIR